VLPTGYSAFLSVLVVTVASAAVVLVMMLAAAAKRLRVQVLTVYWLLVG
jgi:hypothetical protein